MNPLNWLSPAALWGILAAIPAVGNEYLYKLLKGPWHSYLYIWIPSQMAIGYCIYRLVTIPNTTLMDAFVVWAMSTIAMRVFVTTVLLGEVVKPGTWYALGLIVMARIAQACWGR